MTHRIGWIGCGTHASQMLLPQLVQRSFVKQLTLVKEAESIAQSLCLVESVSTDDYRLADVAKVSYIVKDHFAAEHVKPSSRLVQ